MMQNQIMPFAYEGSQVRTITIDGEPWFVAKDICDILELGDTGRAMERIEPDEGTRIQIDHPQNPEKVIEVYAVNEPGLYSLVLGSRKPEAKTFKRWITREVLPAIRKTGTYSIQPMTELQILRGAIDQIEIAQKTATQALTLAESHSKTIEGIKETLAPIDKEWRRWINKQLQRIGFKTGDYQGIRNQSYEMLEARARCDLERRMENLKNRMRSAAATKTQINNVNHLDVIEAEPRLKEIYTAIVKELSIKYVA